MLLIKKIKTPLVTWLFIWEIKYLVLPKHMISFLFSFLLWNYDCDWDPEVQKILLPLYMVIQSFDLRNKQKN